MPIFAPNYTFLELYKRWVKPDYWCFWDNFYQREPVIVDEFFDNGTEIHTINRYNLPKFIQWEIENIVGISRTTNHIGQMNSTLAMMINIALHKGFTTIYLIGFDNMVDKYEHWYDVNEISPERKKNLFDAFKLFDKFMSIIEENLTAKERIVQIKDGFDYFETVKIEDWIKWLALKK
jgi:hypothetical protein